MQTFEINAEPRESVGKGASRRLRKTGKVPGIVYGTDKEAVMISVDQNALGHQLDNEAFYSHVLTLNMGKNSEEVVLKDLQRHAYKKLILHIDFQRIDAKEKLAMRVPLHFINEATSIGVKTGGGVVSQAGALRHGISRALLELDASLRPRLKKAGLLTRDSREKESKKYGLKRARKAQQWTKR